MNDIAVAGHGRAPAAAACAVGFRILYSAHCVCARGFMWKQFKLYALCSAALFALCAAYLALSALWGGDLGALYALFVWAVAPLAGGALTVWAVRRGMWAYTGLLIMPVWPAVAQRAVAGTSLDIQFCLGYALLALICSATGLNLRQRAADRR